MSRKLNIHLKIFAINRLNIANVGALDSIMFFCKVLIHRIPMVISNAVAMIHF